jgi:hypothetical protein
MSNTSRSIAALCAAALLATPGAALARGGGTGGGGGGGSTTITPTPTPTPTADPVLCDFTIDGIQADGSTPFSNQAGDAGCVTVRSFNLSLSLYRIALTPGWTYVVTSNGGTTSSRVLIQFTNPANGCRVDFKVEPGKTDIRQSC